VDADAASIEWQDNWLLTEAEKQALLMGKTAANQLGISAMLKYFQNEGRFPERMRDLSRNVLTHLKKVLNITVPLSAVYKLPERSYNRFRQEIREFLGIEAPSSEDHARAVEWLCSENILACDHETVAPKLHAWFQVQNLEFPSIAWQRKIVREALRVHEQQFFQRTHAALSPATCGKLDEMLAGSGEDEDFRTSVFTQIKNDPARSSLKTVLKELKKLETLTAVELPKNLFQGIPDKTVHKYRLRASTETIRELRQHPNMIRYTLLAAFCYERNQEIVDGLVELLVLLFHKIKKKAEKKVAQRITQELQTVHGKPRLLYQIAEAALDNPEGIVKEVVFPVVDEKTLTALVKEYQDNGFAFKQQVQLLVQNSYKIHYRRMIPRILAALDFKSNNVHHKPVIEALSYLKAHEDSQLRYIDINSVPVDAIVPEEFRSLVIEEDKQGKQRIRRIPYELTVLQALRRRVRCKEIWVEGAKRYRNPDDDIPRDFAEKRPDYYALLEQPMDAGDFIGTTQNDMRAWLKHFNDTLPGNPKVRIRSKGKNLIWLTPLDAQPEPIMLASLKQEIARRWPMTNLLDMLKEAELRIGFTGHFKGLGNREVLSREDIQKRLLFCLYGLGSNAGLKRILSRNLGITYDELLYIKRKYIYPEALRAAIAEIANAIFQVRAQHIWGETSTACASDSKHFGSWDQNLMTEWHVRYRGRGVMIYWHVEKNSNCIYSQLQRCSASEVASMITGVLRHCTEMSVHKQYVDTHGQSEVGFAFCYLLGFDLMPRLKNIAKQKLSVAAIEDKALYSNLTNIINKDAIDWALIRQQYDEMVKLAVGLKTGTAEAEAILRRYTEDNTPQHPTYKALAELGRAIKTIFLCRYLSSEQVRREIQEGLNVVENWNSANSFIFFGKNGEINHNQTADQEASVLSLHLLQICMVYINTLMIQEVLSDPGWLKRMRSEDFRALTPLIYVHVNPYGIFDLDMRHRLPLQERKNRL
jgi:TnpA family transposase